MHQRTETDDKDYWVADFDNSRAHVKIFLHFVIGVTWKLNRIIDFTNARSFGCYDLYHSLPHKMYWSDMLPTVHVKEHFSYGNWNKVTANPLNV